MPGISPIFQIGNTSNFHPGPFSSHLSWSLRTYFLGFRQGAAPRSRLDVCDTRGFFEKNDHKKNTKTFPNFANKRLMDLRFFFVDKNEDHPVSRGMSSVWDMVFAHPFLLVCGRRKKDPESPKRLEKLERNFPNHATTSNGAKKTKHQLTVLHLPFFGSP